MLIRFADNQESKLIDCLCPAIDDCLEAGFAVSFVKRSGISLIRRHIETCLSRGGQVEFLVSLDFHITEAEAIMEILNMGKGGAAVRCYCYRHNKPTGDVVYHPKLYILKDKERATFILGSSNLTSGGLAKNVEANVVVDAPLSEEIVSDACSMYNRLKFIVRRVEPDSSYIEQYAEVSSRIRRSNKEALKDPSTLALIDKLREKEQSLPSLNASPNDLAGWQRLVFNRLPGGIFSNKDVYMYEQEFKEHYPLNRNIRPKIRQVLQDLAAFGLIKHLGPNRWQR